MLFYRAALPLSCNSHLRGGVIRRHRRQVGSSWRKCNPGQQALLVLAHLRKGRDAARQRPAPRRPAHGPFRIPGRRSRPDPAHARGPARQPHRDHRRPPRSPAPRRPSRRRPPGCGTPPCSTTSIWRSRARPATQSPDPSRPREPGFPPPANGVAPRGVWSCSTWQPSLIRPSPIAATRLRPVALGSDVMAHAPLATRQRWLRSRSSFFTEAVNVRHPAGLNARFGPCGSLESRTARPSSNSVATSMQSPPLLPLSLLLRQVTSSVGWASCCR